MAKEVTTCSELERFGYCPLSWWLSRKGVQGKGKELQEGIKSHKKLEKGLSTITLEDHVSDDAKKGIFSYTTISIALALPAIFSIIFWRFLELELVGIMVIIALLYLLVACFFLYRMLSSQEIAVELRKEHGIPAGKIDYSDTRDSDSLFSKKYMLSGKPDFIIEKDGVKIPVEVKTGRVPKGPHFSHILQLAGYCLLVEEVYGQAPPYGVVEYSKGERKQQHKIDYDKQLKDTVIEKLELIKSIEQEETVAHRNHNRTGKCRNCSRKVGCLESLVKHEERKGKDRSQQKVEGNRN